MVAIIGVLVAISIPIFTSQLEKAREATDAANIRSAYAEVQTAALTDDDATSDATGVTRSGSDGSYVWTATVNLTQKKEEWQSSIDKIGGIDVSSMTPEPNGTATVTYTESTNETTITFSGK